MEQVSRRTLGGGYYNYLDKKKHGTCDSNLGQSIRPVARHLEEVYITERRLLKHGTSDSKP